MRVLLTAAVSRGDTAVNRAAPVTRTENTELAEAGRKTGRRSRRNGAPSRSRIVERD